MPKSDNKENVTLKKPKKFEQLGVLSQVVRVNAHVRDLLNSSVQQAADNFRSRNESVFESISQYNKKIREAPKGSKDKEDARKSLDEYKESQAVKDVMDRLKKLREPLYRVNAQACDKFLLVTHQLIADLIDHGIYVDTPRIFKASYNKMTHPCVENLTSFPLLFKIIQRINSRPIDVEEKPEKKVKKPKKTEEEKAEDKLKAKEKKRKEKEDNESDEPRGKRKGYYQSAITNALKKREAYTSDKKKIMLPADTCQFLADVVSEFVHDLVFYIKNLVDGYKVKTVTSSQIDLALKFMFFHEDHDLSKYESFMKRIGSIEPEHSYDSVSIDMSEKSEKTKKKNAIQEKVDGRRRARKDQEV